MIDDTNTTEVAPAPQEATSAVSLINWRASMEAAMEAAIARHGPLPEDPVERLAWYCHPDTRELPWEPPSLMVDALISLVGRLQRAEARVALLEEGLSLVGRLQRAEARVDLLEEELASVRAVLPSRARALAPDIVTRLRTQDPYAELEVLEDWNVGSWRFTRGTQVRLDLHPRLEDAVRSGLLVGTRQPTVEEQQALAAAEEQARQRALANAVRVTREAEAAAAAARARAEVLAGGVASRPVAG